MSFIISLTNQAQQFIVRGQGNVTCVEHLGPVQWPSGGVLPQRPQLLEVRTLQGSGRGLFTGIAEGLGTWWQSSEAKSESAVGRENLGLVNGTPTWQASADTALAHKQARATVKTTCCNELAVSRMPACPQEPNQHIDVHKSLSTA